MNNKAVYIQSHWVTEDPTLSKIWFVHPFALSVTGRRLVFGHDKDEISAKQRLSLLQAIGSLPVLDQIWLDPDAGLFYSTSDLDASCQEKVVKVPPELIGLTVVVLEHGKLHTVPIRGADGTINQVEFLPMLTDDGWEFSVHIAFEVMFDPSRFLTVSRFLECILSGDPAAEQAASSWHRSWRIVPLPTFCQQSVPDQGFTAHIPLGRYGMG